MQPGDTKGDTKTGTCSVSRNAKGNRRYTRAADHGTRVSMPLASPSGARFRWTKVWKGGQTFQPDVALFFSPDFPITPVDVYGIRYDLVLEDAFGL
jgi:hypothetical protein